MIVPFLPTCMICVFPILSVSPSASCMCAHMCSVGLNVSIVSLSISSPCTPENSAFVPCGCRWLMSMFVPSFIVWNNVSSVFFSLLSSLIFQSLFPIPAIFIPL